MIVERVNEYLDKGLKIFKNERGTPAVSQESIFLLIYAWNSTPILLPGITHSMVVTGQLFHFQLTSRLERRSD